MKLWKGLFFCMWMADKPLTQQRLARDLADLLNVLRGRANFCGFVQAFWLTLAREWSGIDALRMDKFLYLVRCYINQGFECIARQQWSDRELLQAYLEVLEEVPFNYRNDKIPNGLRYHVIDIYVDELDKVDVKRKAPLDAILEPMRELGRLSHNKTVKQRVEEALDHDRLKDWQGEGVVVRKDASETLDVQPKGGKLPDPQKRDDGDDDDDFSGFED